MNDLQNEVIGRLNIRTIERPPDYLLEIAEREKVYVGNTYQREHKGYIPGIGEVVLLACPAGKPYGEPLIIPGIVFENFDNGNGHNPYHQSPARTRLNRNGTTDQGAADDFVKNTHPKGRFSANLIQWGVFISDCWPPKPETVAAARRAKIEHSQMFVADADERDLQNERREINGVHREMAAHLNVRKPWNEQQTTERALCPACGSNIAEGAAKCPSCAAILDPVRWAQYSGEVAEPKRSTK